MSLEIGTKVWQAHDPYSTQTVKADQKKTESTDTKKDEKKNEIGSEPAAVYERSATDRAALVEQMKNAEREREKSLTDMVRKLISGQGNAFQKANGGINISGTVSQEAIRKAKEDISEDGYYGVKQTSQRLFDFASALAGDDVEKMQKMQKAMNKGIGQAARMLGGDLPSICKDTQDAANQLFKNYYESKGVSTE